MTVYRREGSAALQYTAEQIMNTAAFYGRKRVPDCASTTSSSWSLNSS